MNHNFNNIVLIDTYNSLGTGIILPCRYDRSDDKDFAFYIIITNYHVLHSREKLEDPVKEISCDDISLTIFDKDMRLVPGEDYEIVKIEAVFSTFEEEDIAAILVRIRKAHEIAKCCRIGDFEELQEGDDIYTKGFPGILQEETEALPIRFMGSLQLSRYKGGKMGTYRTQESFHFYSDYRDEDMFCGLSGGPVFMERDGEMQLLGMNQGIFADNYGDSPYQLIRFMEMKHILEYLRQNGCILYSLLYGNISVIWTKDEKQNGREGKEALCVLGGSGAGKSSFLESMTQHAQILETVGDGQTTRTDIYYYLSLYNNKPDVKVCFLNKKDFADKMDRTVFPDLLALEFEYKFGWRKIDIRVDPYGFLRANLDYLKILLTEKNIYGENEKAYLEIESLCINAGESEDEEEIRKCYTVFCNIIYRFIDREISKQVLKTIFDIYTRTKIMKSFISLNECSDDTDIVKVEGIDLSGFYENGVKGKDTSELVKNLSVLPYKAKESYVCAVLEADSLETEVVDKESDFSNALRMVLEEQKGIFSYREVRYLFGDHKEDNSKLFGMLDSGITKEYVRNIFGDKGETENNNKVSIYGELYEEVMDKLGNDRTILQQGLSLVDMTLKEKELINLCVRGSNKRSLSAFIDHIEVRDSYYCEYAVPIYESKHNEILLIDTCGLDHIDKGKGNRFTLKERVEHIKLKLGGAADKYHLNNIIYLKKLDAGKPTEISDIFAYIADMDIEGGLYCVFTGLDIYENSNDSFFAKNKNWHIDHSFDGYPKVMQYLVDRQYKEELLRMCNCVSYRKEDLYRVMSRNVITYCANRRLIEKQGKYQENNIVGIRTLFESVFQKEIDSSQLCIGSEADDFERIFEKEIDKIQRELRKLIILMFDLASVTKWQRYYWQTLNANLNRYIDGEKGFARSYNHTWQYLFVEGYRKTFESEYAEDFYKLFGKYENTAYSLVRQIKYNYVRDIIDIYLEEMYREASITKENIINVYDAKQVKTEKTRVSSNVYNYAEILKKITNFGLVIRTCTIESGINKLVDYFLKMFIERKGKTEEKIPFLETRADIRSKTDELIKALKSYGFKEEAVKALFCIRVDEQKQKEESI